MVEFAWDRIDEAMAKWALERLPAASPFGTPSWLGSRCQEWARGSQGETWAPAESYFVEWASKEGLHSSRQMLDELGRRFVERHFEWVAYLYPELGEDVSEADEIAAIEAGTINAAGFRYVGAYRDLQPKASYPQAFGGVAAHVLAIQQCKKQEALTTAVAAEDRFLEVQADTPYCYAHLGRPLTDATNLILSTS